MSGTGSEPKTVAIGNMHLDGETYRAISMMAYRKGVPVEVLIDEMLKKHLAIQGFLKHDFDIIHREIIRALANSVPDDKLIEEAKKLGMLAREMVILNVGSEKPDVKKYIKSFTSFMDVNDYAVSVSEDKEEGTISFYAKPEICRKYSLFWAEIIRMTLESIAEVTKVEATETTVYFECKVRTPPRP